MTDTPDFRESMELKSKKNEIRTEDYLDDSIEDSDDIQVPGDESDNALLLDQGKSGPSDPNALEDTEAAVRRNRAQSFTFDFSSRILLSSTAENEGSGVARKHDSIGVVAGIALIIGMQIGSGIFSSPGVVAQQSGSVGASLLLWFFAGLLSWAGASSFAELGSALPLNGGAQAYLLTAFGELPAYCFSFSAVTALKPGSQAIISVILGEYLCRVFYHTAYSTDPNAAARNVPQWSIKLVAILGLSLITSVHAWSSRAGTHAGIVLTTIKVLALLVVFAGGLVFLILGRSASPFTMEGSSTRASSYALGLFSALWTYDGWDQANYVSNDCKPGTLPRIINLSMLIIVILFVSANISYFLVLPFATASQSSTVGLEFGRAIGGPVGGVIFALIVSLSCLGAMNTSLFTTSRLVVAAGEQGFIPKVFSKYNARQNTPINALALSTGLSFLYILLGDFAHLTLFYGVCAWTWNLLVVIGLLVLRIQQPALDRPYKTFLVTPVAFACTALFLLVLSCFTKPWESLAAFTFCGAGAVPFYIQKRRALQASGEVQINMNRI